MILQGYKGIGTITILNQNGRDKAMNHRLILKEDGWIRDDIDHRMNDLGTKASMDSFF